MVDCNAKGETQPRGNEGASRQLRALTLLGFLITAAGASASSPPILSRPITFALEKFKERGGEYVLGPNDCSVFVTDFLKACGKPVKRRYTTADLWLPSVMSSLEMRPVALGDTEHTVFVTRYINAKGRWVGHCGVILTREGQTTFVHNSEAGGGVIVEPSLSFEARMLGVNVTLDQMKFFTP